MPVECRGWPYWMLIAVFLSEILKRWYILQQGGLKQGIYTPARFVLLKQLMCH